MNFRMTKDLKMILHPYIFVLKEGQKIQENPFDYSLSILQLGKMETIKSPRTPSQLSPEGLMLKSTLTTDRTHFEIQK